MKKEANVPHKTLDLHTEILPLEDAIIKMTKIYGPCTSVHQVHSLLEEELDEIKKIVYMKRHRRNKERFRAELLDLAAMALKSIRDIDVYLSTERTSDGYYRD